MTNTDNRTQHSFLTATLSLGLATTARLGYPPLSYASALSLVYMGIPSAQTAYEELVDGRTLNRAFIETAALTVCLAQGHLLVGSLAFSLYHAGCLLHRQFTQRRQRLAQMVRVQEGDQVVDRLVVKVKPGERVLFSAGELTPLAVRVVEGSALVNQQPFTPQVKQLILQAGDALPAGTLILVGQLCITAG
jgi:cation transport ATPase